MSSAAGHTPGPWTFGLQAGRETLRIISAPQGKFRIAEVLQTSGMQVESDANARLIAAAPDLLAVLIAVDDFWAGGDAPPELTAQMRAALAKATGSGS